MRLTFRISCASEASISFMRLLAPLTLTHMPMAQSDAGLEVSDSTGFWGWSKWFHYNGLELLIGAHGGHLSRYLGGRSQADGEPSQVTECDGYGRDMCLQRLGAFW